MSFVGATGFETVYRDRDEDGPVPEKRPTYRFNIYAERWLAARDLKPRTRAGYQQLLDALILPVLGQDPAEQAQPDTRPLLLRQPQSEHPDPA